MTNLIRWDPFADLRGSMDRLFDEGFSRPWRLVGNTDYEAGFPVEVSETETELEVKAALPGVRIEVEEAYIHCSKHIPLLKSLDKEIHWGTDNEKFKGGDFFKTKNCDLP